MAIEPRQDLLNRANFGLLPETKLSGRSFAVSAVLNATILAAFAVITLAELHKPLPPVPYQTTTLILPIDPPKIETPKPPPVKVKVPPPPPKEVLAKLAPPKIVTPKIPDPPKIEVVKVNTPVVPNLPPAPPKQVAPPPAPKLGLFASNQPTLVANNKTAPSPKVGGFGDPVGVAPNPNATRAANIAAVGSFNNAVGADSGAGAARKGSVQGVSFGSGVANGVPGGTSRGTVASAGFSSGVVGGTGQPGGKGVVKQGAFGGPAIGGTAPAAAAPAKPTIQQAQISVPKPGYTPEATKLHIEGNVVLQVRLTATGQVEVLHVVQGLGHGLDELAVHAAQSARFRPAMEDGHPVDTVVTIRIAFQLA